MASKFCPDGTLDAFLQKIDDADRLFVCSDNTITTYANAVTYALATATITPGAGGANFGTIVDDTSGRKLPINQISGQSISVSGTAAHIVLGLSTGSVLLYVTTCTPQVLTSGGGTVTIPAWKINIQDPT
jgi:hypothetical protein